MHNDNIPDEIKIYELSLIWKEAEYNFAFWDWLSESLDWDKAYKTALSAVLKTKNLYEYYLELMRFVSLLCDGHTRVWFPKIIEDSPEHTAKLPIATQFIGGERVITNVKRASADKIKRWSIIKKVNGISVDEYTAKNIYPYVWHEKRTAPIFGLTVFLAMGRLAVVSHLNLKMTE